MCVCVFRRLVFFCKVCVWYVCVWYCPLLEICPTNCWKSDPDAFWLISLAGTQQDATRPCTLQSVWLEMQQNNFSCCFRFLFIENLDAPHTPKKTFFEHLASRSICSLCTLKLLQLSEQPTNVRIGLPTISRRCFDKWF